MTASLRPGPVASTNGSAPTTLRVAGLRKVFDSGRGRHEALRGIDLEIIDGEFLTVLGPSGCGKTTLLRILAGFESPTDGEVWLDGRPITHVPPNKRPMAMVFQNYALFPHLTVFENIAYGLKVAKLPRAEIRERVDVALTIMNLVGLGDRLPTQLSGGQQQRVALARSVVVRPRVLLFDEPLSNLDARLRDQMRFELRRIQRQLGVTSVYVTHDQSEAMAMSDRIVVMNDGRVEQIGLPHEIYSRPSTLFVADFIGKANVVPAQVLSRDGSRIRVEVLGARLWLEGTAADSDAETVVMLRPEHVEVVKTLEDLPVEPGESVSVPGRIQTVEYLGGSSQISIELVDGTLLTAVQHHGPGDLATTAVGDASREVVVRVTAAALRVVSDRPRDYGAVS